MRTTSVNDYLKQVWLNHRISKPELRPVSVIDTVTSVFSDLDQGHGNNIEKQMISGKYGSVFVSHDISLSRRIKLNWQVSGHDRILRWDKDLLGAAFKSLIRDTHRASTDDWIIELRCYFTAGMANFSISHFPQDDLVKTALNVSVKGSYIGQTYSPEAHSSMGLAIRNAARIAIVHQGTLAVCQGLGHGIRFHVGLLADGCTRVRTKPVPPSRIQRIVTVGRQNISFGPELES